MADHGFFMEFSLGHLGHWMISFIRVHRGGPGMVGAAIGWWLGRDMGMHYTGPGCCDQGVFGECAFRSIQTPDRLHMSDETLAGLAFVFINKRLYHVAADQA